MTTSRLPSIAVIGGGITGLVAAHSLQGRARVTLIESSARLGGKIRTTEMDGLTIEEGPDSFLPRDDRPLALCRELGLGDELVTPSDFGAWLWIDGRLRRLPEGFVFGLPSSPPAILRSRILSAGGVARAAAEIFNREPLRGPDVSIGDFVGARFGHEVVERLVDPLLAGTRAGNVENMSLAAAAPAIDQVARQHRSVTLGLRNARRRGIVGQRPQFYALRRGMSSLVTALVDHLDGVEVRTSVSATSIAPDDARFVLTTSEGEITVDGVVLATPAHAAASLLGTISGAARDLVGTTEYASVAIATLIYPPGSVTLPERGSGFLVPRSESKTLAACTWFSRKWPHLVPGDGRIVLRCFAGRYAGDPALAPADRDLVTRMRDEVGRALDIAASPLTTRLTRWDRAIPQLEVGHLDRVDALETELSEWPSLALAGAGYRGTGIPDCIAQGQAAAERVLHASR